MFLSFRSKGEKILEVDGERIRSLGEHLGDFPSVILSSRDFRLIRDGPSDRRKWLDLCFLRLLYHISISCRVIQSSRERNVLLKKEASDGELLLLREPSQPMQLNYTLCPPSNSTDFQNTHPKLSFTDG